MSGAWRVKGADKKKKKKKTGQKDGLHRFEN